MLKSILKAAAVLAVGVSLAACTASEQRVARYGVGGAALGALAGTAIGESTPNSALTGAAVGAFAGTVTGVAANQRKQQKDAIARHHILSQQLPMCTYRTQWGRTYQAPCTQQIQIRTPQLCTYQGRGGVLYQAPCHRR
ncbi:YMGG-like glycine zipper-containing protein [Bartonella sp. CB178]|uniref:YMGG-like glycine zipper-containing protein n=1 Tax=Bartonella sp. CB178 TaxID=3112255 RepID=UPI00300E1DE3